MQYITKYQSPLGNMLLAGDEEGVTGLWFEEQKYFAVDLAAEHKEQEIPVFKKTKKWLDLYFTGKQPNFTPPLHLVGTEFQNKVWQILLTIPYGQTMTYGEIAKKLTGSKVKTKMSAQAVGGAVGHNKISILVPCHRVVGSKGSLTGYAGGLDKKIFLLTLEGVDMSGLYRPKKGTAL